MLHFARTMSDCLISSKRVFAKLEPVSSVQYLAVKIQWCEAKHKCEWQSAWAEIKFLFTSDLGNGGKDLSINIRASFFLSFSNFKYNEKAAWKNKLLIYLEKTREVGNFA